VKINAEYTTWGCDRLLSFLWNKLTSQPAKFIDLRSLGFTLSLILL
jgi:hypothetical protein